MKARVSHCLLAVALAGCQFDGKTPTVATDPGKAAMSLNAEKDAQIAQLKATVTATEARNTEATKIAASAAGNVAGVLSASEHISEPKDEPAKEAVVAEANLAKAKLPAASPADLLEAERRVNLLLTGQRDAAKAAYGAALKEVDTMKAAVAAKDAELATHKAEIEKRDASIVQLGKAAQIEREAAAKRLQDALAAKDKEIADLKNKWSANLQLWTARVFVGFGILAIVGGIAVVWISGIAALGKAGGIAVSGLLLIVAGLIVGHRLFLPIAGSALGVLLIAGCWYLWHLRRTHQLEKGMRSAVQDVKDAAAAGSETAKVAARELADSLIYRFPRTADGSASGLEKEIDRRLVSEGINAPKK